MAHVGQKVTFGSIGRLCGIPRHGQIFFGVLTRFHEFVEGVGDHLDLTAAHLGNGGDHLPIAHAGRCLVHGLGQNIQGAHHPRHKEPQQRCHHQQQQTTECQHFSVEVFDRRKGLCRGHHRSHDPSRAGQFFEGEQPFDTPRVDTLLCALKTFHGIFKWEVTAVGRDGLENQRWIGVGNAQPVLTDQVVIARFAIFTAGNRSQQIGLVQVEHPAHDAHQLLVGIHDRGSDDHNGLLSGPAQNGR